MATIDVKDAAGVTRTLEAPNANGRQAAASSRPVALSNEDKAALDAIQDAVEATLTVGLPAGASTAANQADILTELELVNTNLTAPVSTLPVQPMMAGGAALTNLAFSEARINVSSSGDTALVTATSSQTTKVYRLILMAAAAVTVQFKDGSTVLLELPLAANQGVVLDFTQYPFLTTSANTALNINLSAAVSVQGRIYYIKGA